MKILITLFVCISSAMLSAQMSEFAPIGAKWWYDYDRIAWTGYMEIKSEGDTVIMSKSYRVLSKTKHCLDLSVETHPLLEIFEGSEYIRQEDSVIYYLSDGNEYILYDFRAGAENWKIDGTVNNSFINEACDTNGIIQSLGITDSTISGLSLEKLKTIHIENTSWTFHEYDIFEKAGCTYYLFPDVSDCVSTTENFTPGPLRCYEDGETGLLKFSENDCDYIYLDVDDPLTETFNVYPNPATDKIYCEVHSGGLTELRLNDITGRKINISTETLSNMQLVANLSSIEPGVYFLTFFGDKKIIGTQKIIKQ